MAGRAEFEKQALKGLASSWEECRLTRRRLLLDSFLLKWPKPELTGVPSYASASLNYNTLEPLFRLWAANTPSPKTPKVKQVWELVGQKSTKGEEAAEDAAGENSDYEPQDPDAEMDDGLGIGDDLVPFVNGRLDDEDEPCAEEISGPSNEPSPEVSGHPGNARAEHEDSNAEQATLEVSGHADNAGAEKEDFSAEQPTLEVSVPIHGNNAVLESTAAASVQPELIVCSDDEELETWSTATRVETQMYDIDAAAQSWQEADGEPVDLEAEASGSFDDPEATKHSAVAEDPDATKDSATNVAEDSQATKDSAVTEDSQATKDSEVAKSRGVQLARVQSFAERAQSRVETQMYDIDAAAQSWQEADGEPVDLEAEASGSF
eukprot:s1055_g1.t1